MVTDSSQYAEKQLGLRWLVHLRWIAVAGQTLACVVAAIWLRIHLPIGILAGCIGLVAASNGLLEIQCRRVGNVAPWVRALVLSIDVIALTVMLFHAGGAHNPFTMFYLLLVTMGVILLPAWGAWGTILLCTVGFWTLFYSDSELQSGLGGTCCNDIHLHLQGMVVGMVLTGSGIVYFVGRLTENLRQSRRAAAQARMDAERARRSVEVATLAAGIAHELATPLATIAVVSRDLEEMAGNSCGSSCCREDAKVIRQEVERCRLIIERLGRAGRAPDEACQPLDWENLQDLLLEYLPEPIRDRLEFRVRPSGLSPRFPVGRLMQALSILVKNATEASTGSSPVILEASLDGLLCCFRVIDTGPGFPAEVIGKIGEPLVSTKTGNGGLGLGLYLVKSLAGELGGKLEVRSSGGNRTIVQLQLPCRT